MCSSDLLLVKLARGWGSTRFEKYAHEVVSALLHQLDDGAISPQERLAAAGQLVAFQPLDKQVVVELLDRISPQTSSELASGIVAALQASTNPEAGKLLVGRFRSLTPQTRLAGIRMLLSRQIGRAPV